MLQWLDGREALKAAQLLAFPEAEGLAPMPDLLQKPERSIKGAPPAPVCNTKFTGSITVAILSDLHNSLLTLEGMMSIGELL